MIQFTYLIWPRVGLQHLGRKMDKFLVLGFHCSKLCSDQIWARDWFWSLLVTNLFTEVKNVIEQYWPICIYGIGQSLGIYQFIFTKICHISWQGVLDTKLNQNLTQDQDLILYSTFILFKLVSDFWLVRSSAIRLLY